MFFILFFLALDGIPCKSRFMSVSRWIQDTGNLLIITPVTRRAYGVVLDHSTVRIGVEGNSFPLVYLYLNKTRMNKNVSITKVLFFIACLIFIGFCIFWIVKAWAYLKSEISSSLEQRKINKQILDLELELSDLKSEWEILDSDKLDFIWQIELLSGYVQDIEQTQKELHTRANEIRKEIDVLKWSWVVNEDIVNCYQWTWQEYNDCLDSVVGFMMSRQAQ